MLDPCNSFLDSELDVEELEAGPGDHLVHDLDITGTLFATLLTDESNLGSSDILTEIMSSTSDSESDEVLNYLSKTEENLMQEVNNLEQELEEVSNVEQHETVRKTRSCAKQIVRSESFQGSTVKQSIYNRPPLMCSTKVNMKSPRVVLQKVDSSEKDNYGKKTDKCMNKNAIIARENREKKKQYVHHLENSLEKVKMENYDLKTKLRLKSNLCDSMQKELKYLRNVLANQSCISALLSNIHNTEGVAFTSSLKTEEKNENLKSKKRPLDENDNYENGPKGVYVRATGSQKKIKTDSEKSMTDNYSRPLTPCPSPDDVGGGVCLHVSNNKVSLELCSTCAESASSAWNKAALIDVAVKESTVRKRQSKRLDSTV